MAESIINWPFTSFALERNRDLAVTLNLLVFNSDTKTSN